MASMQALIWALIVTVMDQATPARRSVSMSAQDQKPASARTTRGPAAPARRTRATSSSTNRLWPRWEDPLRSRAWRISPVLDHTATSGW